MKKIIGFTICGFVLGTIIGFIVFGNPMGAYFNYFDILFYDLSESNVLADYILGPIRFRVLISGIVVGLLGLFVSVKFFKNNK